MTNLATEKDELENLLRLRFGEDIPVPEGLSGMDQLRGMAAHRSCRRYRNEPISEALIRLLAAVAYSVPSKSDLQQSDMVWVRNRRTRDEIEALLPSMPWISDAPVFLVICGNGRRLLEASKEHGEAFANQHLDHFFNTAVDAALVLQNLIVAAEAVGLGTCPISGIRNHPSKISELLTLPDHVYPVAGLCLGWPESKPTFVVPRLPLKQTFHVDQHDDASLLEDLAAFDKWRGELEGKDTENDDFVGWSKSKARMNSTPQQASFGAFVRDKGFNLD